MGKALVIGKSVGSITVQILRDLSRLNQYKTFLDATIIELTANKVLLQGEVNAAQGRVDDALTILENAIAADEPVEEIRQKQNAYTIALNDLVGWKQDFSTNNYRLLGSQKKLTDIDAEIGRDTVKEIATADSATGIIIGQEIGICEIARRSGINDFFVALPSDSEVRPNRHIYNPVRDGIHLPKLAEQPYGWWYNTMVVPSAQIYRPRYWTGILLAKNDGDNDGTIFFESSKDFGVYPTNEFVLFNVEFEYEDSDSLAFQIGDLVLIEFNSLEVPLIIGFADTADKPKIVRVALYEILNAVNQNIVFLFNSYITQDTVFPPVDTSNWMVENITAGGAIPSESTARGLAVLGVSANVHDPVVLKSERVFGRGYNIEASGWDASVFSRLLTDFKWIVSANGVTGNIRVRQVYQVQPEFSANYDIESDGVDAGDDSITGLEDGVQPDGDVPLFDSYFTSRTSTAGPSFISDVNAGVIHLDNTINPMGESDPSMWRKLKSFDGFVYINTGINMPSDYLIDDNSYLEPVSEEQRMTLTQMTFNSVGGSFLASSIILWKSFAQPSNDFVCNPIPDGGVQNYLQYSEQLINPNVIGVRVGVDSITLKSPDCVDDGAGIIRVTNSSGTHNYRNAPVPLVLGNQYNYSCFIKRDSFPMVSFGTNRAEFQVQFDLIKGVVVVEGSGVINSAIESHDGDWWRLSVSIEVNSTTAIRFDLSVQPMDIRFPTNTAQTSDFDVNFNSNGINGYGLWGMQVVDGTSLTEYVKTTGVAIL